jgi:hypothetical protein
VEQKAIFEHKRVQVAAILAIVLSALVAIAIYPGVASYVWGRADHIRERIAIRNLAVCISDQNEHATVLGLDEVDNKIDIYVTLVPLLPEEGEVRSTFMIRRSSIYNKTVSNVIGCTSGITFDEIRIAFVDIYYAGAIDDKQNHYVTEFNSVLVIPHNLAMQMVAIESDDELDAFIRANIIAGSIIFAPVNSGSLNADAMNGQTELAVRRYQNALPEPEIR